MMMSADQPHSQLVQDIDALLEYHQIPACSVCVVNKDDGIVWKHFFGDDSWRGDQHHPTTTTNAADVVQFHLYSGTKLYTGVAILKLIQQGQLQLSDPVVQYLPPAIASRIDARITVEHCLGHVSGLADTPRTAWLSVHDCSSSSNNNNGPTLLECLQRFDFQQTTGAPGTCPAQYVNLNYVLLGVILERVSGVSYSDYIQQEILPPLHSQACVSARHASNLIPGTIGYWNSLATYFVLPRDQYRMVYHESERLDNSRRCRRGAGLYTLGGAQPFDLDCTPIGGLVGTAPDFAPLLREVLRAYSYCKPQPQSDTGSSNCSSGTTDDNNNNNPPTLLLSPASWNNMVTKHFDGSVGIFSKLGVGLAFKMGLDFVNHEGGGPGFTSESRCYLEDGLGMVILMNKWSLAFQESAVCHEICELVRAAFTAKKEG